VAALARRFGIKPEQVAALNGVATTARFGAGQSIKLAVPQAAKQAGKKAPPSHGKRQAPPRKRR
jgi:hypothetical protein